MKSISKTSIFRSIFKIIDQPNGYILLSQTILLLLLLNPGNNNREMFKDYEIAKKEIERIKNKKLQKFPFKITYFDPEKNIKFKQNENRMHKKYKLYYIYSMRYYNEK